MNPFVTDPVIVLFPVYYFFVCKFCYLWNLLFTSSSLCKGGPAVFLMNLCFVYETLQQLKMCEVMFSWIAEPVMHIFVIRWNSRLYSCSCLRVS